jgi:hypothetical protein
MEGSQTRHYPGPEQIILDQLSRSEEYSCPFAQSSIGLTALLLDILKVGQDRKYFCSGYHSPALLVRSRCLLALCDTTMLTTNCCGG